VIRSTLVLSVCRWLFYVTVRFQGISSGCIIFPIKYGSIPLECMPTVYSHNSAFLVFSFYCMYTRLAIPRISRLGDHYCIQHGFEERKSDNKYKNPVPRVPPLLTCDVIVPPGHK
jgi:hypothetical protein